MVPTTEKSSTVTKECYEVEHIIPRENNIKEIAGHSRKFNNGIWCLE